MPLTWSRYSALVFAIGLGIGEAVINWGHWQYAPLWVVDYVIVAWLLLGFFKTRLGKAIHILLSGWAFTSGVFYMALFVSLDPELALYVKTNPVELALIGIMFCLSLMGLCCVLFTIYAQNCTRADKGQ